MNANSGVNERFVAIAREFHKDHGCAGSESFETCTAEICVMARSMGGLTQRTADLGKRAHVGDPCIYCGVPHDNVGVGDCPNR